MSDDMKLPQPGILGTHRDSCAVCLKGTDTGTAFTGEAEWAAAGLVVLGLPSDRAVAMVSKATGCDDGRVPEGTVTVVVRVCQSCAAASGTGMKVGLVATGVPSYSRRGGDTD